jgi:hypothetical protein
MSKDSNPNNKLKPSLFSAQSFQKIETNLTKQVVERDQYIAVLEEALHEQGIEIPEAHIDRDLHAKEGHIKNGLLQQGTAEEIQILINNQKQYLRDNDFPVEFYDLTMSTEVPVQREIFSSCITSSSLGRRSTSQREISTSSPTSLEESYLAR